MDHFLINPNQIWAFGIYLSDNPFDEHRDFGIDHEDLFVPFGDLELLDAKQIRQLPRG